MSCDKNARQYKGNSLIAFPNEYISVDLETTGLNQRYDEIIEIGAAHIRNNQIIETYQQLVNPRKNIESSVELLTGITNEMLSNAPLISDVFPSFADFIGKFIIIGHNVANFDMNFLYDTGMRFGNPVTNDFVDTMRISRILHKNWKHNRLIDLCQMFQVENNDAHRSLSDAIATYEVFECMRKEAITIYGTIDEFIKQANTKQQSSKRETHGKQDSKKKPLLTRPINANNKLNPFYGKEVVITGSLGYGWTKKDKLTRS